jgi:hypothetical protein
MLTLNLQILSKSIPTKEACTLVITAASPSHSTQVSIAPGSQDEGSEEAANKSYIRHSTFNSTSGSTTLAEVCSYQSEWQTKEEQIKALQEKATEA